MIDTIVWVVSGVLVSLKLSGVIDWNWFWVLSPAILTYGFVILIHFLAHLFSNPWSKK